MTHSLEVSQISRTIARSLRLNEDLTEAIALGHDVGHTPFGHSGEAALDELTGHFCHNEQSLRVVEYLEKGGQGLDLTFAVKDGILNHSGRHRPKTLEGRIVHLADRIAYLCHDYDDSLRAGMMQDGDLPQSVYRALGHDTSAMITGMVSDIILNSLDKDDILQSLAMKAVMDEFRRFMFDNIYHSERLAKERQQAVYVLRELFHYYMEHVGDLPDDFRQRESHWGRRQTVTDYIAGLTDSYAVTLFHRIFLPPVSINIEPGSKCN
jgi:dGTPase